MFYSLHIKQETTLQGQPNCTHLLKSQNTELYLLVEILILISVVVSVQRRQKLRLWSFVIYLLTLLVVVN